MIKKTNELCLNVNKVRLLSRSELEEFEELLNEANDNICR